MRKALAIEHTAKKLRRFGLVVSMLSTPFTALASEKVGLLVTGWGSVDGVATEYTDYIVARSIIGEKTPFPGAPCTENHVGVFPWRSEKGLVPYVTAYKTEGFEHLWDGFGLWTRDDQAGVYVSVYDESLSQSISAVDPATVAPLSEFSESGVSSMRDAEFGPDPRDGTDHLAGIYRISAPNGLHDVREMALVRWIRIWKMLGADRHDRITLHNASAGIERFMKQVIPVLYGESVDLRFGYYAPVNGLTREIGEVAVGFAEDGFDRIVIARETTDHNTYANTFWDLYHTTTPLCRAGFKTDGSNGGITLEQVRQVGRTPEYNTLLVRNLQRHIDLIPDDREVALLYTTYGLPWPGANPEAGPFSAPQPFIREVFHENAYLNSLSFRPYARAAYDISGNGTHRITFARSGDSTADFSANSRTRSLYAYGMTESARIRLPGDEEGFRTLREVIETAIRIDSRENIILVLSHWFDNTQNTLLDLRLLNNIPLSTIEDMERGTHWMQWCERYTGPGAYDQQFAIDNTCPDGWTHLQVTEAFDDLIDDFAAGYLQRIRGGLERFGVFPNLGIDIVASGDIDKTGGGSVAVLEGPLTGARLDVPPDPRPAEPESLTWAKAYRPEAAASARVAANTGDDAIRALNDFTSRADYMEGAKDSFTGLIGTQRDAAPGQSLHRPGNAVSPLVYVGPYRTLFNAPARVTLPFNAGAVRDPSRLRPVIYNDLTGRYDPVYPVAGGDGVQINTTDSTLSFDVQTLGVFALTEDP